ncbi:hypothetical protein [Cohnella sp. AR92]|uniref:hypothetical protein n=1 Tax=Cohnella sp. AR92 TaxID=648716 RepID=UPI000F8D2750|nr:hypothetical protein [Cohnella sp. AR92]RUS42436.1 hypothetical protein ELR57_26705 [Cohnella sp. AR92]
MPLRILTLRLRRIAIAICLLILATGCASTSKQGLIYSEVSLASEPAAPAAKMNSKLIVKVDNPVYSEQEAEVQLQINSKKSLPSLIDATREGDVYTAEYAFPSAGEYTVTIHMNYEDEHFAFAKKLTVQE